MELIKLDIKVLKYITIFMIVMMLYYMMQYRPITYELIRYSTVDSPYISPEGWPLPYPPSFK